MNANILKTQIFHKKKYHIDCRLRSHKASFKRYVKTFLDIYDLFTTLNAFLWKTFVLVFFEVEGGGVNN